MALEIGRGLSAGLRHTAGKVWGIGDKRVVVWFSRLRPLNRGGPTISILVGRDDVIRHSVNKINWGRKLGGWGKRTQMRFAFKKQGGGKKKKEEIWKAVRNRSGFQDGEGRWGGHGYRGGNRGVVSLWLRTMARRLIVGRYDWERGGVETVLPEVAPL